MAELGALLGLDFEAGEAKIESEDVFDFDDVVVGDEFVDVVDYDAVIRIFANAGNVENVAVVGVNEGAGESEGDDFESVWIDNGCGYASDLAAGLDAKNWSVGKTRVVD